MLDWGTKQMAWDTTTESRCMTGYNYELGMSNGALEAYDRGLFPISRLKASDLKAIAWPGTLKQAKLLAEHGEWQPCEWHHSGGTWYNQVHFYDLADLAELDPPETRPHSEQALERRVAGFYSDYIRGRGRGRYYRTVDFTGIKKGNWIHLEGGGKKKADGNHITYHYT